MIQRLTLALCATLLLVGPLCAQDSTPFTPVLPLPMLDEPAPTSAPSPLAGFWDDNRAGLRDANFWMSGEYLFAFVRGMNLPALVTTSPANTSAAIAGVIGTPGATTLFGDSAVNQNLRAGFRLSSGYWFGPERKLGIEGGFMIIGDQSANFTAASNGSTILARPFINAQTGAQQSIVVAFPGTGLNAAAGTVNISANSGTLYEYHIDFVEKSIEGDWFRINTLLGYRSYIYNESIQANQTISPLNANFDAGTKITTNDSFSTRNTFNGIDAGFRTQFFWNNFSLDLLTKIAFGNLNTVVNINGNQVVTDPSASTLNTPGGLLAQSTNIGSYHRNQWWTMPEGGVGLNWQVRSNVQLRLGYTVLALNGIARAGSQIDPVVNPALFTGAAAGATHPAFHLDRTDLLVQSINLGLTFTY